MAGRGKNHLNNQISGLKGLIAIVSCLSPEVTDLPRSSDT